MAPLLATLTTLLAALLVTGNPLLRLRDPKVTKPLSTRWNPKAFRNLAELDGARARRLIETGKQRSADRLASGVEKRVAVVNAPITESGLSISVTIGVGCPATQYSLLLDTGSSNTWIGSGTKYTPTSCSKLAESCVSVTYGSGSFSGKEYNDTVTLGPLALKSQSIGVAPRSMGFEGIDGILGLGPTDLDAGTVCGVNTVPTITDTAFAEGLIPANEVGIFLQPVTSTSPVTGELTFGGADSSKTVGSFTFGSTTTSPSNEFWGFNQSIKYGTTTILATTAGIVDASTFQILIASNAYNQYVKLTSATADSTTGLLKITSANFSKLQSVFFVIGGTSLEFTADAQLLPPGLVGQIGGTPGTKYLVIGNLGTASGSGLDFIMGFTFLERYYSLYDTTNKRVGFAQTASTFTTIN